MSDCALLHSFQEVDAGFCPMEKEAFAVVAIMVFDAPSRSFEYFVQVWRLPSKEETERFLKWRKGLTANYVMQNNERRILSDAGLGKRCLFLFVGD